MKVLPWICALSLAANLAFIAHATRRPAAPADAALLAAAEGAPPQPAPARPLASDGVGAGLDRAATPLAALLAGSDLRAMRDALVAAGLNEAEAKAILRLHIRESQGPRREAIAKRPGPEQTAWWYRDDHARDQFEEQRRADRRALDDEVAQTLAGLFGPEAPSPASDGLHAHARFLPESKRQAVSQILKDYEAMLRQLPRTRDDGGDPFQSPLPSDVEKWRYLDEQRDKDLAALLGPEELREFTLRHSPTAQSLNRELGAMRPTLAEFGVIHDALADFETRYSRYAPTERPPEFWQERQAAESQTFDDLRAALGESRFIDYALSNDHAAPPLRELTARGQLSPDALPRLWKLRQEAGETGQRLLDDSSRSKDEKLAELAILAKRMRAEVDAIIPPDAASDLQNNDLVNWVAALEKNRISTFHPLGNRQSGSSL